MAPTPADRPPSRIPLGLLRDILALLLILAGAITVVYVAWDFNRDLAIGVIGLMGLALGVALAGER